MVHSWCAFQWQLQWLLAANATARTHRGCWLVAVACCEYVALIYALVTDRASLTVSERASVRLFSTTTTVNRAHCIYLHIYILIYLYVSVCLLLHRLCTPFHPWFSVWDIRECTSALDMWRASSETKREKERIEALSLSLSLSVSFFLSLFVFIYLPFVC